MRYNVQTHGYSGYGAGCRCDKCRAEKAAYMRNKRAQAKARADRLGGLVNDKGRYVAPIDNHGTRAGYKDHKCRCFDCTETSRAEYARRAQMKREAS